jgi:hypothetical protein
MSLVKNLEFVSKTTKRKAMKMKKTLAIIAAVGLLAVSAYADSVTVSLSVTGGQAIAYSDPIPVSGILEKIEIVQTAVTTNIVIASYSGTTAIDTYVSLSPLVGLTKLIMPAFLPTDNTGTALTSATDANTNSPRVLVIPYRQAMIGGNVKLAVDAMTADATVTATIYFTPTKR